jgi:hypothetical protein
MALLLQLCQVTHSSAAGRREVTGRGEGVGVLAEDAAASGEDVLVQLPGPLILTQLPQVGGEVAGRGEAA